MGWQVERRKNKSPNFHILFRPDFKQLTKVVQVFLEARQNCIGGLDSFGAKYGSRTKTTFESKVLHNILHKSEVLHEFLHESEVLHKVVPPVDAVVYLALPAQGPGHLLAVPVDTNTAPSDGKKTITCLDQIFFILLPVHLLSLGDPGKAWGCYTHYHH